MNKKIIEVKNLRKTYGSVVAVEEISFEVYEGEIFGMVGPNGAGKTTTVECVEGLRKSDKGELRILGLDPHEEGYSLRHRIGVQLQETALQDHLKVWEALDLFASFYSHPVDWQSLLEKMNLAEKRNAAFYKLSGGQKQRLFIALSLVNNPELVFFDELTTGLDPQASRNMWDMVQDIREQGKTVVLTTHFMEEAERLCDRVAIVDQGRIVALDTPENLIRDLAAENRVVFTINGEFKAEKLNELASVTRVEQSGDRCEIYGWDEKLIVDVVNALSKNGCLFRDLRTEQPTLEDVFLALTGREMRN